MPIDLSVEDALTLAAATKLIPPTRGRKTHLSTLVRWITNGIVSPDGRRVHLEAVRLGGRWVTSREALTRFAARLTPAIGADDGGSRGKTAQTRTPSRRKLASLKAGEELERLGI